MSGWLTALVIGTVACVMLWWIWARGCHVLFDFGREVYVAWQLSDGRVLYADLAHLHGPFSPYACALVFKVFGPSVAAMAWANAAVLACLLGLLGVVLSAVCNRLTVFVCLLFFVLVFAFSAGIVNCNFIYPYATEATHGFTLSVAAIAAFWIWLARGWITSLAAAGVLVGCTFLTKAEVFFALVAALGGGLALANWLQSSWRERGTAWMVFLAGAVVPPAFAWLLLAQAMSPGEALQGTAGAFRFFFDKDIAGTPFYRKLMGTANLRESLFVMGTSSVIYLVVVATLAVIALRVRGSQGTCRVAALAAAIALVGLGGWFYEPVYLFSLRPLPLAVALAGCATLWRLGKHRHEPMVVRRTILESVVVVFSLVMLLKIILNTTTFWYGFTLAAPGTLVSVVVLVERIPALIQRSGGCGLIFKGASLGWCAAFMAGCVYMGHIQIADRTYSVSRGSDKILCQPFFGVSVDEILIDIARITLPGQTMIVMPEGALINLFANRVNQIPYLNYNPTEVHLYGEDRMLAALEAHPPDFLLWAPREMSGFDAEGLGVDYGTKLGAWLKEHYRPVARTPADNSRQFFELGRYRNTD